jgi:hypothetical protein
MKQVKQINKTKNYMNEAPAHYKSITVFLLGALLNLLAAIDFVSLLDYCVKGIAGGLIWLGFQWLSEVWINRLKTKLKTKTNNKQKKSKHELRNRINSKSQYSRNSRKRLLV